MHITFLPSTLIGIASHINLREEPQAKSLTLSALNIHVLVAVALFFSAAVHSSSVTISVTSL